MSKRAIQQASLELDGDKLRAENARLREALAGLVEAWNEWRDADSPVCHDAWDKLKAAFTQAKGGGDEH